MNELGIRFAPQNFLPDIDISGNVRLAVGIDLQARLKQKEARVWPEGMLGGDRRDDRAREAHRKNAPSGEAR